MIKKTPLVSIHIITYNQVEFIHETLTSAIEQDYENLEVVVADDGSKDGTAEVILKYAEQYPNILLPLVGGQNLGITGNSNRGLKACSGKYIAFQGGDDVLLPGKISTQVTWLEEDENRVLCGHPVEVFSDKEKFVAYIQSRKMSEGWGASYFIRRGVSFQGTSIMIRASAVPKDGFDERLGTYSDDLFFMEVVKGGRYGYVKGVFARYRQHGSNVSKRSQRVLKEWDKMYEIICDRYPHLKGDIYYGVATRVTYGKAIQCMKRRQYKQAAEQFLCAIKQAPFYYKSYFRFLQSILYLMLKKKAGGDAK